jgi:hypothetical protein
VAKVGTSKAGGTISQQAVVHPWLAADAHNNNNNNNNMACLENLECCSNQSLAWLQMELKIVSLKLRLFYRVAKRYRCALG